MLQKNNILFILSNFLKRGNGRVMVRKVMTRLKEPNVEKTKGAAQEWCKSNSVELENLLSGLNSQLYVDAVKYSEKLFLDTEQIVKDLPFRMGGGGDVVFAYFVCHFFKPSTILETGVSMGFTSRTFLEYIDSVEKGRLYSSDFPYFRIKNPEDYIGCVVPDELKRNWDLETKGDQVNLPKLLKLIDKVDLFHYDSDKSYEGRKAALDLVRPMMSKRSIIIIDDIGDNFHFKNEIVDKGINNIVIQSRDGGFIGIFGDGVSLLKGDN